MRPEPLLWNELHWPIPTDVDLVTGFLRHWASNEHRDTVVLETAASAGQVTYRIGSRSLELVHGLEQLVPGLRSQPMRERALPNRVTRVRLQPADAPLVAGSLSRTVRGLLAALGGANQDGEWACLQVVLGSGLRPERTAPTMLDPGRGLLQTALRGTRVAPAEVAKQFRSKSEGGRFLTDLRIVASAKTEERQRLLVRELLASIRTLQSPLSRISLTRDTISHFSAPTRPGRRSLVLATDEVAHLLALPISDHLPGVPSGHPKRLPLRTAAELHERQFARTDAPGPKQPLGIHAGSALKHTAVIGPTGAGKSTLLLNLISADLRAGRGLVLIDPNGDLARDVLRVTPLERRDDIVLLDPTSDRPVGFNPLRSPGTSPELAADRIVGIIRSLFPSMFGPRTSDVLHASVLTLMHDPGSTLADLPKLLSNDGHRSKLIGMLGPADDVLAEFWAGFNAMSAAQQAQFAGPVLARLRQFLLRPQLKRVLDQARPRFDLRRVFTDRAVLIVPLNTGLIGGDAARLIGSLLVAQLWQLTLGRAALEREHRPMVSIYIDEAAEYLRLGGEVGDALARSRGLGVAWHLAFQYRDQFPPETRIAIDVNTLNKIAFTLTGRDARDLAADTADRTREDFTALGRFEVYAQLDGVTGRGSWVSGHTLPAPPSESDPDELIAWSQHRYGMAEASRDESRGTSDWSSSAEAETPIGRRRRNAP